MSLSKQEFTNAGRDMLGAAQAGDTLHITKIVVGSGGAATPSDLWPLVSLIVHELDVTISSKRYLGDGVMLVEGNFKSEDAPHAFYLKELGIMGQVVAEGDAIGPTDQLYSVANVFAEPPDYIDPAAPTIQSFKIKLIVDRVDPSDIVVEIGPTEAIMGENVGDATTGPGPFKEADGNILKFKRFVAGDGIELEEAPAAEDGADTIEIRSKTLRTNVDLYVPESYPGITDPDVLFPTVQAAHDYLLSFHIPADKLATIHVYSGHFANTIPIQFTHPDATRIAVTGLAISSRTFRAASTITRSGALPNMSLVLPLNDTSGIVVNDIVFFHDAPHAQMEGCGIVTAVTGTNITISMHVLNVLPPTGLSPLASSRVIVFPTQFTSSISSNAPVFNCPNGINRIKNFACRSTVAQQSMSIGIFGGQSNSTIEHCIAYNFAFGFGISGPVNLLPIVAANNCDVGIQVGPQGTAYLMGANGTYKRYVWSGNDIYGLWVAGGSYVTAAPTGAGAVTYACSNVTGIRSDTRAWVGVGDTAAGNAFGLVVGYNVDGCVAALLGIIQSALATESAIQANVTHDFVAGGGAHISVTHNASMPPSSHFSPLNHVLGDDGAYIDVNL